MKLTIDRAALLKALGHVQSVVERRNTIPILSNVLLSASAGPLALSATDLDMEIADLGPARVERDGQVTAPAHTLYEIVRELPEGADVALSHAGGEARLHVEAGRARFNLPALPAGDFPVMSSEGLDAPMEIATAELIRLFDKARFAMSTEETRYYFNGLYLHVLIEDGVQKLRAVATDSRRLAYAEMPAPQGFAGAPGVIIPRKAVGEARRLMDGAGESVTIGVSAQKVRFGFGHATLTSKVIDGAFPRYEQVLPRENTRLMTVDTALFAAVLRRGMTIPTDQSRPVSFALEPGRMTLSVRSMDAGQAVEELEVGYDGPPFEVSFNARYVLDAAAHIGGETAQFRFSEQAGEAMDPALLLDPTDPGVLFLLMPMRF